MPVSLVLPSPAVRALEGLRGGELTVALYVSPLVVGVRYSDDELVDFAVQGADLLGGERLTEWDRRLNGFWSLWSRDLETPALLADHRSRFPSARRLDRCVGLSYGLVMHLGRVSLMRRHMTFPPVRPLIDSCPCEGSGTLVLPNGMGMSCPAHAPVAPPMRLALAA